MHSPQSITSFPGLAGGLCSSTVLVHTASLLFIPQNNPVFGHAASAALPEGFSAFPEWRRQSSAEGLSSCGALQGFKCLGMWFIAKGDEKFDRTVPVLLRSCSL